MALYPSLFGYVELPDPDVRRPQNRPADVRVLRRPRPFGPFARP
jgi:hypothetical protein